MVRKFQESISPVGTALVIQNSLTCSAFKHLMSNVKNGKIFVV